MNRVKILSGLGLMLMFSQIWAGAITDISVDSPSDTEKVVKITFDSAVPKLSSFATAAPPRIALDFPSTAVKMTNPQLNVADNLIKMTAAAENNGRARVLLGLSENANYTTEIRGNVLLVRVGRKSANVNNSTAEIKNSVVVNSTNVDPLPVQTQVIAPMPATSPMFVDFHRTEGNAGRLTLRLPTKEAPVDVSRQGDKLIITLLGNRIPAGQLRKYNVGDYATPAKRVDVRNEGRNGKIVIDNKGDWTFASFQKPNEFIVEVTEKAGIDNPRSVLGGDKFVGQKLSLNFQNIEVRSVLQVIAEFTALNIVVSDKVGGSMTLRLADVPWDQALNLILDSNGLVQHREGNIIRIETTAEYGARVQEQGKIASGGELQQRIFKLKYKEVEVFRDVLKLDSRTTDGTGGFLSSRGSVLMDPGTNTLIVKDVVPVLNNLEEMIKELDIAKKQVMIEARIVEAKDDFTRSFGVKFGPSRVGNTGIGSTWENAVENVNVLRKGGDMMTNPSITIPAATTTSAAGVFGIFHAWSSYAIGLELSAAQLEAKTRMISTPRILTADREEGSIEEGSDIPYQETSPSGGGTTAFKKATTSLKVTPQITPDGNIMMDVEVKKNSPSATLSSDGELVVDIKEIKTKATVENGGTVIIGGIYVRDESETNRKIPFLADIPILGHLFKGKTRTDNQRELLVFLTPRILADVDAQTRY